MPVRVVVPQPVIRLENVIVDYDLTPVQAVKLLPVSNSNIAAWAEGETDKWNGGKTGVVEGATLPILWPHAPFSTGQGREMQAKAGIGFAMPVEIASLALPENDPERLRRELYEMGVYWLVALRPSNSELWCFDGNFRPFCLRLGPHYFEFYLGYAVSGWDVNSALAGALQVPSGA